MGWISDLVRVDGEDQQDRRFEEEEVLRDRRFAQLVRQTKGVQPWRRLFHAFNGTSVVVALTFLPIGRWMAVSILGALLAGMVLLDGLRLTNRGLNRRFFRIFAPLASPREARGVASSTWYALGVVLTLLLFPRPAALAGILVLALADPAAGLVGKLWGRRRLGTGTWEGSGTFAVVAFLSLLLFVPWWAALLVAVVTAALERMPWPLDDNLVIPPIVAGLMLLLGVP